MFKYIILFLCISLSGGLHYLDENEGADCMWEDLEGKCVKETRCLTTLDVQSPKHPICLSEDGKTTIVCCTDCELVNDTKNAVFSPTTGIYWKDGRKARDHCLQYLNDLPYPCKQDDSSGIERDLDDKKKCYSYSEWTAGSGQENETPPSAKYPHQVLLGFGDSIEKAEWTPGGFIISDKFIVTAAQVATGPKREPGYAAMGVKNRSDAPGSWQMRTIKRIRFYSEFKTHQKYHDIALIETDIPIKFDKDVLPACLHVDEDASVKDAITTTWYSLERDTRSLYIRVPADTIQTIKLEKFGEEECKATYALLSSSSLRNGIDSATQLCYGSKTDNTYAYDTCKFSPGEPLLVDTQFSTCVYTAIGVTSFGPPCGSTRTVANIYTRVSYYVPWIESVVWP